MKTFNFKQKRAYNSILTGLHLARRCQHQVRFLTLTTSQLQREITNYDVKQLRTHVKRLIQIIRRTTPNQLLELGYLSRHQLPKYYQKDSMGKKLKFEYFNVQTSEGNGVAHILFRGDYIPYNYLVNIWQDIHNSWELNIQRIDLDYKGIKTTAIYVIAQYVSNQDTKYVRSSQSWGWTVRGHRKEFKAYRWEALHSGGVYYNPVQNKYYRRKKQIDFYRGWVNYLYMIQLGDAKYVPDEPPPVPEHPNQTQLDLG